MPKSRIEKQPRLVQCKNPECEREFTTTKYGRRIGNQEHCSNRCRQRHWFLRKLHKKRSEAVTCCPKCGVEYAVQIIAVGNDG